MEKQIHIAHGSSLTMVLVGFLDSNCTELDIIVCCTELNNAYIDLSSIWFDAAMNCVIYILS